MTLLQSPVQGEQREISFVLQICATFLQEGQLYIKCFKL